MSVRNYLDQLCGDNPDGIVVAVVFKSNGQLVQGALRKVKGDYAELFELTGPAQVGDPRAPKNVVASNIFEAEAVERVVIFTDLPRPEIVTPRGAGNGGIIIPT